jgi:eukaryotic-like serine/threonine-protein kinase
MAATDRTGQWERAKELFEAALRREPAERGEFLREGCAGDARLLAEVESLLAAYAESNALSQGIWPSPRLEELHAPASIGPYRLIRKLGVGGMGQVWLAEQAAPLQRQVALKLIRIALYEQSLLQRFQTERQSLAMMEHPVIAKVFDAGATAEGQPYFVMEYVPGSPITTYCDQHKLTIRERLTLFIKVCEGVQHAHQKAVIHRDLKPANILVVELDGEPMPRIIDFGLAKAVASTIPQEALATRIGALVGTPGYMSPEQAAARADIDTRTDVYSLGVILYELLTGQLPAAPDAPRPSARAGKDRKLSGLRGTDPKPLVRLLRGDLDVITMKALEADRERRYGMPAELAADIARYLEHEPIVARPANAAYRAQKYVQRHRVAVGIAAGLVILLAGFAGVQAVQLHRITRERDRANRITDFMTRMFKVSDPSQARGNQVTAREILDKASAQVETGLARDPDLQSQMMMVMAAVYENLGLYEQAGSLYAEAAAIRERQSGPEDAGTLSSKAGLAWSLYRRGHYAEAEQLLRQVVAVRTARFGTDNNDTIGVMDQLGAVLNEEGHATEAESLERRAFDFRRRVLGDRDPDTLVSMNHLALTLQSQGRWPEAEQLDRQQLLTLRQIEGADSPQSLLAADNLAIILYRERRYAEAESLDRETLATKRRVLGPDHPETVRSMNTLTAVLTDEGKLLEARKLGEEALAIRTRVLGPEHPLTLSSMSNLAEILTRLGDYPRAEDLLRDANATEVRVLGPDHPATALSTYNLGALELRRGRRDQALQLLQHAVDHGLPSWVAQGMSDDPDLELLRGDPRFVALLARVKAGAVAANTSH